MDIKGLDYNTQREKLVMPEYGREIQKMVDLAVSLPDKRQRNACAHAIIQQMEGKNPQIQSTPDYEHTLWDHLYLMSHKQLDIDWPYDVSCAEKILNKPQPIMPPRQDGQSQVRHYGQLLLKVFEQLKSMPEGPARDALVCHTANQMKRDLMTWGHGSVEDEKVADDLARFTDGKIQLDLNTFHFSRSDMPATMEGKRKKKK
jgi:hypothetical protein